MYLPDGHKLDSSDDLTFQSNEQWDAENDRRDKVAIGIRLGQLRCTVSYVQNGELRDLIPRIPSLVTFTRDRTYCGTEAVKHSISNISNSIYQFFGLLGRRFEDKSVQQFARHCTYRLVKIDRTRHPQIPKYPLIDEDIGVPIQFTANATPHIYTVIDIVSQFLEHIIRECKCRLSERIDHVAISVPNTFGQSQRLALMQAAKEANIEPLRLVTSCMAASVCLQYHHTLRGHDTTSHDVHSDDYKEDATNHHDDSKVDYTNSPYTAYHGPHDHHNGHFSGSKNGYYNHHNGHHHNQHNHYGQYHHHHHHHDDHRRKRRKRKKRKSRSRCYLVADLSNIGCSLSIIECKQKR